MAKLQIGQTVNILSNKPARYMGKTDGGQHRFLKLEKDDLTKPYEFEYMKTLRSIKPCKADKLYCSMIDMQEGEYILFETSHGLMSDQIDIITEDCFLTKHKARIPKNKAFIYATGIFDRVLQEESPISDGMQCEESGNSEQLDKCKPYRPGMVS